MTNVNFEDKPTDGWTEGWRVDVLKEAVGKTETFETSLAGGGAASMDE